LRAAIPCCKLCRGFVARRNAMLQTLSGLRAAPGSPAANLALPGFAVRSRCGKFSAPFARRDPVQQTLLRACSTRETAAQRCHGLSAHRNSRKQTLLHPYCAPVQATTRIATRGSCAQISLITPFPEDSRASRRLSCVSSDNAATLSRAARLSHRYIWAVSERLDPEQVRHQWVRLALAIGLIAGLGSCTAVLGLVRSPRCGM
jgi:hypothetical protein